MFTMWTTITTSRRQGQTRECLSEGSPSANVRADGQTKSPGAILNSHRLAKRATCREVGRNMCTKVRNFLALGTGKRQAILTTMSSKGYWHLSRTLATQTGMTTDRLKRQGLDLRA